MVEPSGSLMLKLTARKLLRDAWDAKESSPSFEKMSQAACLLCVDIDWLISEMKKSHYFGSFWELTEEHLALQGWATVWPAMDVTIAIPELRSVISRITADTSLQA